MTTKKTSKTAKSTPKTKLPKGHTWRLRLGALGSQLIPTDVAEHVGSRDALIQEFEVAIAERLAGLEEEAAQAAAEKEKANVEADLAALVEKAQGLDLDPAIFEKAAGAVAKGEAL